MSANEFTYLAKSLNNDINYEHDYAEIHQQEINQQLHEHNYSMKPTQKHIYINQEYADDISEITSNADKIKYLKMTLPQLLAKRNLIINETKTEEYKISRVNCDDKWKKCKLLGSILDTNNDIKRRKGLSLDAVQKIKYMFNNKKLSIKTKMRAFDAYISSIFLYNSELWTLTSSIEKQIDSFQHRLLRKNVLNIKWPTVMNNEDVYNRMKANKWSIVIKKRRMRWLGHVMRLPEQTPARKAIQYANEKYVRPRGRPPTTWLSMMKKKTDRRS